MHTCETENTNRLRKCLGRHAAVLETSRENELAVLLTWIAAELCYISKFYLTPTAALSESDLKVETQILNAVVKKKIKPQSKDYYKNIVFIHQVLDIKS